MYNTNAVSNRIDWLKNFVESGEWPEKCVDWPGYISPSGYGAVRYKGRNRAAHRVSYELAFGEIPKDRCVLHKCLKNRPCVNPKHLRLGTQKENSEDRKLDNTVPKGDSHWSRSADRKNPGKWLKLFVENKNWPEDCVEWPGAKNRSGYGKVQYLGKQRTAHRVIYQLVYGDIADDILIRHRCVKSRSCVNPLHLQSGTAADNAADAAKHGTILKGDEHWTRKSPEKIARGKNSFSFLHPDRMACGERNGSVLHPERLARGSRHWSAIRPESTLKGESNSMSKLSEQDVREIRGKYSTGQTAESLSKEFEVCKSTVSRIINGITWKHIL